MSVFAEQCTLVQSLLLSFPQGPRPSPEPLIQVRSVFVDGPSGSGKSKLLQESLEHAVRISRASSCLLERPHVEPTVKKTSSSCCTEALETATPLKPVWVEWDELRPVDVFAHRYHDGRSAITNAVTRSVAQALFHAGERRCPHVTCAIVMDRFEPFFGSRGTTSLSVIGQQEPTTSGTSSFLCPEWVVEFRDLVQTHFSHRLLEDPANEQEAQDEAFRCVERVRLVLFVTSNPTSRGGANKEEEATSGQQGWRMDPFLKQTLFDLVIELEPPTENERFDRFQQLFRENAADNRNSVVAKLLGTMDSASVHVTCQALAARTGGLQQAALAEVMEAFLEDISPVSVMTGDLQPPLLSAIALQEAVESAVRAFFAHPTSLQSRLARQRTGYVDVTRTQWRDIAGLSSVKEALRNLLVKPATRRKWYRQHGVTPSIGVVLHGPPGTGKTMLAKAMATELAASFVYIDLPQLVHAEVGESEKVLCEFFRVAKLKSPCVMFIDELQAAFGARQGTASGRTVSHHDSRLVTTFLTLLDEVREDRTVSVLFVGATNVMERLDTSLLRAGRLDTHLYVGPPDDDARRALVQPIVQDLWKGWFLSDEAVVDSSCAAAVSARKQTLVDLFVEKSNGMTGAELRNALNLFGLRILDASLNANGAESTISFSTSCSLSDEEVLRRCGASLVERCERNSDEVGNASCRSGWSVTLSALCLEAAALSFVISQRDG